MSSIQTETLTWSEAEKFLLDHEKDLNQTIVTELTKFADYKEDYTPILVIKEDIYEFEILYGRNSRTQMHLKAQKQDAFNYEALTE